MRLSIMGLCAVALFLGSVCSVGAAEECKDVMDKFEESVKNSNTPGDAISGLGPEKLMTMMRCEFEDKLESEAESLKRKHAYQKNWLLILLDDLKFRSEVGYTNTVGTRREDGGNPEGLLKKEEAYSVEVGYFGKPAFDFLLLGNKSYRGHKGKTEKADFYPNGSWCSLFDDELKFDLSFGFGRTIVNEDNNGSSLETTNKTFFNVGLRYSLPLDQPLFGAAFGLDIKQVRY